jgi:hypothetical protein
MYNIQNNIPSAIANRAVQFIRGFDDLNPGMAKLGNIQNPDEIHHLSKSNSHIIVIDWFDKFIHRVCNRTVYNPMRQFNHFSMHTIEGAKKFATGLKLTPEDAHVFTGSDCERYINSSDDLATFRAFFFHIDSLLVGLRSKVARFESIYHEKNNFFKYVPVPVPVSIYKMAPKPERFLKIFIDWDDRPISQMEHARLILFALEEFRSNREHSKSDRFVDGLEVLSTGNLPESIRNITTVRTVGTLNPQEFLALLSSVHVYATPIKSSYENPVVESQMGGAYILSTPGTVKEVCLFQ